MYSIVYAVILILGQGGELIFFWRPSLCVAVLTVAARLYCKILILVFHFTPPGSAAGGEETHAKANGCGASPVGGGDEWPHCTRPDTLCICCSLIHY